MADLVGLERDCEVIAEPIWFGLELWLSYLVWMVGLAAAGAVAAAFVDHFIIIIIIIIMDFIFVYYNSQIFYHKVVGRDKNRLFVPSKEILI
jgi:hypothetical protein